MANNLPIEIKTAAISMLCEGSSIRAIERITKVHRDTIMRLGGPGRNHVRTHSERQNAEH